MNFILVLSEHSSSAAFTLSTVDSPFHAKYCFYGSGLFVSRH